MAACICQQTKRELYENCLLLDDDGSFWSRIVDCSSILSFDVETEFDVVARQRRSFPRDGVSSSWMFDVSMSESVPSSLRTMGASRLGSSSSMMEAESLTSLISLPEFKGELEMDAINQNPSMFPLMACLKRLQDLESSGNSSMGYHSSVRSSDWQRRMNEHLIDPNVHINVKLFLCKVIINFPSLFESTASLWFSALCQIGALGSVGKVMTPGMERNDRRNFSYMCTTLLAFFESCIYIYL